VWQLVQGSRSEEERAGEEGAEPCDWLDELFEHRTQFGQGNEKCADKMAEEDCAALGVKEGY